MRYEMRDDRKLRLRQATQLGLVSPGACAAIKHRHWFIDSSRFSTSTPQPTMPCSHSPHSPQSPNRAMDGPAAFHATHALHALHAYPISTSDPHSAHTVVSVKDLNTRNNVIWAKGIVRSARVTRPARRETYPQSRASGSYEHQVPSASHAPTPLRASLPWMRYCLASS